MPDRWWTPLHRTELAFVVHADLTPSRARERQAREWLSREETERWNRFLHHRPRREYSLCRAALRALLCRELGCRNRTLAFVTSHHGKPAATVDGMRMPVDFNVSHSGRHGLIAISSAGRIGVDVEERVPRRDLEGAVGLILTPGERRQTTQAKEEQKVRLLYRLWTMKEALVKGLGTGFSLNMTQFEIPAVLLQGAREAIFTFPHMPAARWQLTDLSNESFAAALALELEPETAGSD